MKNAITNVLTFIGVIAILVALRGTEAIENVVASIHQAGSTSQVEEYREELRETHEEHEDDYIRFLQIQVKPKVSGKCWAARKCNDEELEVYGHAMATYENAIRVEGEDDYVAEYRHDLRTIAFFYEMDDIAQVDMEDPEIVQVFDTEMMPMRDAICIEYAPQIGMGYKYAFVYFGADDTDYTFWVSQEACS